MTKSSWLAAGMVGLAMGALVAPGAAQSNSMKFLQKNNYSHAGRNTSWKWSSPSGFRFGMQPMNSFLHCNWGFHSAPLATLPNGRFDGTGYGIRCHPSRSIVIKGDGIIKNGRTSSTKGGVTTSTATQVIPTFIPARGIYSTRQPTYPVHPLRLVPSSLPMIYQPQFPGWPSSQNPLTNRMDKQKPGDDPLAGQKKGGPDNPLAGSKKGVPDNPLTGATAKRQNLDDPLRSENPLDLGANPLSKSLRSVDLDSMTPGNIGWFPFLDPYELGINLLDPDSIQLAFPAL